MLTIAWLKLILISIAHSLHYYYYRIGIISATENDKMITKWQQEYSLMGTEKYEQ